MIAARDRSARLVASRLAALGHPPDYLAHDAMDALVRGAAGSEQRLRAGLAGALFLAETEDAPRVDRQHVQRALEDAPPALAGPPAKANPLLASRRFWLSPWVALPLYLAAAVLFILPPRHERPASPAASQRAAAPPTQPPGASPSARTATVPPRPVSAPVADASDAAPPATLMPDELPASINIVIGRRTRQAAAELQALIAILRHAGFEPSILPAAPPSSPGDTAIAYFYAEDRRLADRVAHLLDANSYPQQTAPAWPRLVRGQAGSLPPPGSIEIRLP